VCEQYIDSIMHGATIKVGEPTLGWKDNIKMQYK